LETSALLPTTPTPSLTPRSTHAGAYSGLLTLDLARKVAEQVDPSQTYVFFHITSRESMLKHNFASLQIFARTDGRWHSQVIYVRPGEPIARPGFPTALKLGELRPTPDDLIVTLIGVDGKTQARSAEADSADPVHQLLILTTSRTEWDRELFSNRMEASK
jgi:hypothetical protein